MGDGRPGGRERSAGVRKAKKRYYFRDGSRYEAEE
jgi:hypothetical protein